MIAPTGRLGSDLHKMRNLLASTATWTAWCGGADPASRIFLQGTTDAKTPRPFALMAWATDLAGNRADCDVRGFARTGSIIVGIDADVPTAENGSDIDAITGFWNRLDALLDEIEKAGLAAAGITITGWNVTAGPERMVSEQRGKHGDRVQVDLAFSVESWP